MPNDTEMACFELIYAIVNFGKAARLCGGKSGVRGTIILAKGTAKE